MQHLDLYVLGGLCLIIRAALWGKYHYYPHFADKEVDAERKQAI